MNISYEQVVAHQLTFVAYTGGEHLPSVPIIFGHTVFDGVDGVGVAQLFQVINLFAVSTDGAFDSLELGIVVDTIAIEFGGGAILPDSHFA